MPQKCLISQVTQDFSFNDPERPSAFAKKAGAKPQIQGRYVEILLICTSTHSCCTKCYIFTAIQKAYHRYIILYTITIYVYIYMYIYMYIYIYVYIYMYIYICIYIYVYVYICIYICIYIYVYIYMYIYICIYIYVY